jgi:2-oxoglutarate ferredoxin oxidoreductase subunit beta
MHLVHGEPLIFGKNRDKGLRLNPQKLCVEAVELGKDGVTEADLLVHDEGNPTLAGMLAAMEPPEMPIALGVIYCSPNGSYEVEVEAQVAALSGGRRPDHITGDINELLRSGHTWTQG